MSLKITAVFDGHVLRPESSVALVPYTRYILTVDIASAGPVEGDSWDLLTDLSGAVDAPTDWSAEHDHYLYGSPKRGSPTP